MYRYRWNKTQKTSIVQFFLQSVAHTFKYCMQRKQVNCKTREVPAMRIERMEDAEMGEDDKWEIAVGGKEWIIEPYFLQLLWMINVWYEWENQ